MSSIPKFDVLIIGDQQLIRLLQFTRLCGVKGDDDRIGRQSDLAAIMERVK